MTAPAEDAPRGRLVLPDGYRLAHCAEHGESLHRVGALASVWECCRCDNTARGLPLPPLPRRR